MSTLPRRATAHASPARLLCALTLIGLLAAPARSQEAKLGRLFFTPEQRHILDRQRLLDIRENQQRPDDPRLTVNGVVTRSNGKRTVWINGVAQSAQQGSVALATTPTDPGKVVITTRDGSAATARVGDTVNPGTGMASGLLDGGRIDIRSTDSR